MGLSTSKPVVYLPDFEKELPSLNDKVVAITGCTSGTGLVAAKVSARKGAAAVLMLNRRSSRAESAEQQVKAELQEGQDTKIETIPCDLQDFESVKEAATQIKNKYEAIDVLCNNAGIMAMEDKATKDGYDIQMQTNHLSHFLLTQQLFPLLKRAKELRGEARIVNHSSIFRRGKPLEAKYLEKNGGNLGGNGYGMFIGEGKWQRYHMSKLANAVFTMALNDKLKGTGILALSAAPGYAITNLHTSSQGMSGTMWTRVVGQSAEDGTMPLLQCCFGRSVQSGDFWEPANRGNMVGPAVKVELTSECTDEAARTMLWEKSEQACGTFTIF